VIQGAPLTLVDSPPGAGKTWLVERTLSLASTQARMDVCCVTPSRLLKNSFSARFERWFVSVVEASLTFKDAVIGEIGGAVTLGDEASLVRRHGGAAKSFGRRMRL
jgi:hypothetical protein